MRNQSVDVWYMKYYKTVFGYEGTLEVVAMRVITFIVRHVLGPRMAAYNGYMKADKEAIR